MADVRLDKYPVIDCTTLDVIGNKTPDEKKANAFSEFESNYALQQQG